VTVGPSGSSEGGTGSQATLTVPVRVAAARAALVEARRLIEACGYHRRDEELRDAEEAMRG